MKKALNFIVVLLIMSVGLTSCSKDDDAIHDNRDQYVGHWDYSQRGSLTLFYAGQSIGTVPIDENGTTNITKTGENGLKIGSKVFYLNGNRLTSDPDSFSETADGFNMVGTAVYSGTVSADIITINMEITGSWSNSQGASGNFSGTSVNTLTR